LQNISAKHTWDILYICWINTYLSLSNLIVININKNFINKKFKQNTNILDIKIKIVLVEAYNSIGLVECYYGPLQYTYKIITAEICNINRDIAL